MMDSYDSVKLQNPLLIVGIGGVGAKLAANSTRNLGCECLLISNDRRDLNPTNPSQSLLILNHG